MIGLTIIVIFAFVAIAAPLLDQNDPITNIDVAGRRAAPSWYQTSPFSLNTAWVPDPSFHNPTTYLSKWSEVHKNPAAQQFLATSWISDGYPDPGSVNLTYSRQTPLASPVNATISFRENFTYPYDQPYQFAPSIAFNMFNLTSSVTPSINLTITNPAGKVFNLYQANLPDVSIPGSWLYDDAVTLSSIGPIIRNYILPDVNPVVRGATRVEPIVFPGKGNYRFSVDIQFADANTTSTARAVVLIDSINFVTKGWNYGLLGTDNLGRDVFSQLVYGSRLSLIIGISAALIAIGVGTLVGLLAGYFSGGIDEFLMRFTDVLLTIPRLPLLLVLAALLAGAVWVNIVIIIGLLGWQGVARIIRAQALTVKGRVFVESAKAAGAGGGYIVFNHILPNVMDLVWVNFALSIPDAIVTEAALSFLGLGDPTVPTWGFMLNQAANNNAIFEWWWALPPGFAIALLSLGFVLVGYALDDILNPRLRRR